MMRHFLENLESYIVAIGGGLIVALILSLLQRFTSIKACTSLKKKINIPLWLFITPFILLLFINFVLPPISNKIREIMPLRKMISKKFSVEPVYLDGKRFIGCEFDGSNMIYSGKKPVVLEHNTMKGVRWTFSNEAASTIIFLSAIYHGMGEEGKKYVEATFEKIRKGGYLKPTP